MQTTQRRAPRRLTSSARFGSNVRAEMARQGVTQLELAGYLGVTQTQVSARLRGAVKWTLDDAVDTARVLDVDISALLHN